MQTRLSHAAFDGGNLRRPEPQLIIQRADFVADAQFAESPKAVSDVAADIDAIDAVVRQRVILRVNLKSGVAGVGMRCEKPATVRGERAIEFGLNAIGISQ